MNEFINEIKSTLKEEKENALRYEKLSESENGLSLSELNAEYINQGWIEALEYVINTYNNYVKKY